MSAERNSSIRAEAIAGVFGLAAGDRGVERGGDPGQAFDIPGRQRFLEPREAEFLQAAAEADGLRLGQSLVGVGHQRDGGSDRLTHRADAGDVGGGVGHAQAHLHGAEALRQEGLSLFTSSSVESDSHRPPL